MLLDLAALKDKIHDEVNKVATLVKEISMTVKELSFEVFIL